VPRGSINGLIRYISKNNRQRIESFLLHISGKALKKENKRFRHLDGNIYNCCRNNLAVVNDVSHQSCNRKRKSSTGYQGVYPQNKGKGNGYIAKISYNFERIYLGYFITAEKAARAYNKAALTYFGPDAKLNIIKEIHK
jgi:hypothetical protein